MEKSKTTTTQTDSYILVLPADFENEMRLAQVIEIFEKLPYSHKREYIQSVEETKKPETRIKKIQQAIQKLSQKTK